jgi:ankyrin repeat protein
MELYPSPLWKAVFLNRVDKAHRLILSGADVNQESVFLDTKHTILSTAATHSTPEMVTMLLESGAKIDETADGTISNAMEAALLSHQVGVVHALLQYGDNLNVTDFGGETPLHYAANMNSVALMQFLLEQGLDIDAVDDIGYTAMHYASQYGNLAAVEILLKHKCNVLAETDLCKTPEHLADKAGHIEVANLIRVELATKSRCVAFAMGHHKRVGKGSVVESLDPEVLRMILTLV